ncbi:septum formation initiator family protein [Buchnera aphidicola]|uniref:Cell division protein FtsB n=1 Tax=Buchnera aphidicola subsp. Uroleucon sonchi TaxID=118118 RepID=A0A6C1FH40_BUCUN|nr:septum formation initiator family protein [Buchnera aphidicola]QIE02112.1 cell division protein FtsB [Buchnera aphidicola (Uroleucon sonchi)]
MNILKIFLLLALCWLQYSLWLGKNGLIDYIKIYHKVIIEKKNNENLDTRNKQLMLDIDSLNKTIDATK